MYSVIQHQIPWSPTCTTKQCRTPHSHTHTHGVDPTSSAPCSNKNPANQTFTLFIKENKTTAHFTNVRLFLPVTQPVRPWLWSKYDTGGTAVWQVSERKIASCCCTFKKVQCLWCVLCMLSLERHSAGTRCYLGLAG